MKYLFIILLIIFNKFCIRSQEISNISGDSILNIAKKFAYNGNREESRKILNQIIENDSKNYEAKTLLGRTYSWDKEYKNAKNVFSQILKDKFDYKDAILAMIDVQSWSGNNDSALFYANYGLSFFENDETFLIKKAKFLDKENNTKEAISILKDVLNKNPENVEAKELLRIINTGKNKITLEHTFEFFEKPYIKRWHISTLQYSRKTPLGTVVGSFNLSDIVWDKETLYNSNIGKQVEVDFYPKLSKNNYGYLNYGYSNLIMFPKHRAGAEIYQKLPHKFEASLGARFLQFFSSDKSIKNIFIYTGSVGLYYSNFWFSLRPFITPKESGISQSYNLTVRYYLSDGENYFNLLIGTGSSPDENTGSILTANPNYLNSKRVRLGLTKAVFHNFYSTVQIGYSYEEYRESTFRNVYQFNIKLSKKF